VALAGIGKMISLALFTLQLFKVPCSEIENYKATTNLANYRCRYDGYKKT